MSRILSASGHLRFSTFQVSLSCFFGRLFHATTLANGFSRSSTASVRISRPSCKMMRCGSCAMVTVRLSRSVTVTGQFCASASSGESSRAAPSIAFFIVMFPRVAFIVMSLNHRPPRGAAPANSVRLARVRRRPSPDFAVKPPCPVRRLPPARRL